MARPRKEIDYDQLDELCNILCTGEECACVLKVDYSTLNTILKRDGHGGFSEYYKKASAEGKTSLRRAQFKLAISGNPTMLIWLGKQFLEQREPEKVEQNNDEQSFSETVRAFSEALADIAKPKDPADKIS